MGDSKTTPARSRPAHGASEGTHRPGPTRATGQRGGNLNAGLYLAFDPGVDERNYSAVVILQWKDAFCLYPQMELVSLLDSSQWVEGTEDRHDRSRSAHQPSASASAERQDE